MDTKQSLIDLVKRNSFRRGSFQLVSGKRSSYYFDLKKTYCTSLGAEWIGELVWDQAKKFKPIHAVGGMAVGAIPIAISVQQKAREENYFLNVFFIRKERKNHGTKKLVGGLVEKKDSVLIVEDVVTTGRSTLKAIEILKKEVGCQILAIISILDRDEGGATLFERASIKYLPLFSIYDFEMKTNK